MHMNQLPLTNDSVHSINAKENSLIKLFIMDYENFNNKSFIQFDRTTRLWHTFVLFHGSKPFGHRKSLKTLASTLHFYRYSLHVVAQSHENILKHLEFTQSKLTENLFRIDGKFECNESWARLEQNANYWFSLIHTTIWQKFKLFFPDSCNILIGHNTYHRRSRWRCWGGCASGSQRSIE